MVKRGVNLSLKTTALNNAVGKTAQKPKTHFLQKPGTRPDWLCSASSVRARQLDCDSCDTANRYPGERRLRGLREEEGRFQASVLTEPVSEVEKEQKWPLVSLVFLSNFAFFSPSIHVLWGGGN